MTALERWGIEAAILLLCIATGVTWWAHHNRVEQAKGEQVCVQATTETKDAAVANVVLDQTAQTELLKTVVSNYDQKLAVLSADNAALAGRVLDSTDPVRAVSVPHPGSAACAITADGRLSHGEGAAGTRQRRLDADFKALLDTCDANQAEVEAVAAAYNGVRDRALKAEALRYHTSSAP